MAKSYEAPTVAFAEFQASPKGGRMSDNKDVAMFCDNVGAIVGEAWWDPSPDMGLLAKLAEAVEADDYSCDHPVDWAWGYLFGVASSGGQTMLDCVRDMIALAQTAGQEGES